MKAYLSYSLHDREEFIVTLLSNELRSKGFTLQQGRNYFGHNIDFTTSQMISSSQLFLGIITTNSPMWQRVINEWSIAIQNTVPSILLIEEGVNIDPAFTAKYIRFNRYNPQGAIEEIKRKMLLPKTKDDEWGWLIDGAALIALIALLSGKK